MKRSVLYVDDEPSNLIVFEAAFEDLYDVHTAGSAHAALAYLQEHPVPVVVADQRMPEMSGVEMFSRIRQLYPYTQRVILSGFADTDAIIDAINKGQVFQFVRKPWQRVELHAVLQQAMHAHDLMLENSVLSQKLLAAERSALLGQATGRIAHEMANQLNILPLIELIEEDYADDEQLQIFADVARRTHERLSELVNEVKAFMRSDEQEVSLSPVPLVEALHELRSFLQFNSAIPHEKVAFQVIGSPVVMANRLKLHQVFVNLLKNGIDALGDRPDGLVTVLVHQAGSTAVIRVQDNGSGIPPEILARIWEPHFTTKGRQGSGLGLDICRRLIELQAGTIECESQPGVGTTFTIRLPLAEPGEGNGMS